MGCIYTICRVVQTQSICDAVTLRRIDFICVGYDDDVFDEALGLSGQGWACAGVYRYGVLKGTDTVI